MRKYFFSYSNDVLTRMLCCSRYYYSLSEIDQKRLIVAFVVSFPFLSDKVEWIYPRLKGDNHV